jgi:ABC-2 type transport system ATP-binding protein
VSGSGHAIEVTGLRKRFGELEALGGVDFAAREGSVFGLLGPNGAGKTTAVRALTTLMPFDAGTCTVAGLDVATQGAQLRERIGLAGQYAAVDENLTGHENLVMVGRLYGKAKGEAAQRATQLLDRFDLADAGDRVSKTYSGGMRRRLDLAAAIVNQPPVLFLDEPTTGLDPRSRLDLWGTIEELVDGGTTVLLTTQYLEEADRLAEDLAVIDHGQVIAAGTPSELKDRVGGERVDVRLDDPARAEEAARVLADLGDEDPVIDDGLVSIAATERKGAIVRVVTRLNEAGIGIDDVATRRPTLDDVFLTLTGRIAEETEPQEEPA